MANVMKRLLATLFRCTRGFGGLNTLIVTTAALAVVYAGGRYIVRATDKSGVTLCSVVPGSQDCFRVTHEQFQSGGGNGVMREVQRAGDLYDRSQRAERQARQTSRR